MEQALESNREYFNRKVAEFDGKTDTPVTVNFGVDNIKNIPVDSSIRFRFANESEIEFYFNKDRDGIKIYKCGTIGGSTILIKPECSNIVEVS